MSFTTDLTDGLAQLLAGAGIGLTWRPTGGYQPGETGIYIAAPPPDAGRAVTLTAYPLADDPSAPMSDIGVQVRTRAGTDPYDTVVLDDQVFTVLHANFPLLLTTGIRLSVLARTSSTPLGQDSQLRWEHASNYLATAYYPAAHRN